MNDQRNNPETTPELSGQVVPFGKYKGRSVAELAADDGYREWVLSQPWVRERYTVFYNVLIQGGPPPQHSPEHNEMQARFLDESWCLGLMRCCDGLANDGLEAASDQIEAWLKKNDSTDLAEHREVHPARAYQVEFEHRGWDVFFKYEPAEIRQHWQCECEITLDDEFPFSGWETEESWREGYYKPSEPHESYVHKPAEPAMPAVQRTYGVYPVDQHLHDQAMARYRADLESYPGRLAEYQVKLAEAQTRHQQELAEYQVKLARYQEQRHYALDHRDHQNTFRDSQWHGVRIAAELKPDLGDDYPAVLRQVQGYLTERVQLGRGYYDSQATCDAAFLIVRRAQFTSVTWDQVRKIFATSGITLIAESNLAERSFPADWFRRMS